MRKKILLFASVIISTLAMAQDKPSVGIRAGIASSRMSGDAVNSLNRLLDLTNGKISTSSHTGFFGGAYVNIPVSNNLSLEPALYYTQKGYEMNGALGLKGVEFLGANAKAQLKADYMDLPLLLKGNFGNFRIFAGPQLSYLIRSDLKTTAGVLGFNLLNRTIDATQQFNRWDAGLTGGIGYQFENGVNIMASYDHGLQKVDANKNMNSYNRSFKIGLGFNF